MQRPCERRRIKVLHISQATGGVQRHVMEIVSRMDRGRFEITGICPPEDLVKGVSREKESFAEALKRTGVRVYPVVMRREIRPVSDMTAFFKIYNFIKKERFDIVHAHSSKAGFLGRLAAALAGVPAIVYTPNNFAFDRPRRMMAQRFFYSVLERFSGFFCDLVLAVCQDEKNLAVGLNVLPREKIRVISNFITPDGLKLNVDTAAKRRELGISGSDKLVVSAGRAAPQKAPEDFVKAAERVLKARRDVRFLFLGDGPLLDKVTKLIRKKGISEYVRFPGWRNDSAEIVAACDIFVLSSLWEVLPNHSLLDAMALAKPVVLTDTSGAHEAVADGINGFIVEAGNYRMLGNAILRLLAMPPDELEGFGRRSRALFDRRPGADEIVRDIEDFYVGILHRKGRLNE